MRSNHGFSLLEILIVIAITSFLAISSYVSFSKLLFLQSAKFTIQQLKSILSYARSAAIAHKTNVTVCPSINKNSCGGMWQHGILVDVAGVQKRFFAMHRAPATDLSLRHSGFLQQRVQIQPDGMTYTHGHFTYKSLKPRYIASFNLYFNRALRTYETQDD